MIRPALATNGETHVYVLTRRGVVALAGVLAFCLASAVFGLIAFNTATDDRRSLQRDEQRLRTEANSTRAKQKKDEPATACLLDVFREVRPLLLHSPGVERPLEAFLELTKDDFPGVRCPIH